MTKDFQFLQQLIKTESKKIGMKIIRMAGFVSITVLFI
jgi:hypothetical protein